MNLTFYRWATTLLSPFIVLYLRLRRQRGKEDSHRFKERFGIAGLPRPQGKLLWIHAASVGESLSILPLMQRISDTYPEWHLLMTTGTVTSATMVAPKLPPRSFHHYIPVDTPAATRRFINHWQPDLALWVESELWPNLVTNTAKQCPMILVNARLSERSFAKWKRYPTLAKTIISSFSLFLAQSNNDAERLELLGAKNIHQLGNLKYDAPPLIADPEQLASLQQSIGNRPLWVAASTHHPEELLIAETHRLLKQYFPELLTIIIPRHASRGNELAGQLREKGHLVAQRSVQEPLAPSIDIYLADTMGELGLFYRLAPIVCIGGSFIPHGGQNPLEAARLGCAIISGHYTHNFTEIYAELASHHAAAIVEDKDVLYGVVKHLLEEPKEQQLMAENALTITKNTSHVLDNIMTLLAPLLKGTVDNSLQSV